ncbi:arginine N-succinyltransferase [Massilia cavernae]|nr:arginine N-succinyltransferase [Massilia cavernae]
MYVVRPVEMADLPRLEMLCRRDNQRVHTLPQSRHGLAALVEQSVASFQSRPALPADERYTFVLESAADGALAGTASLVAQAGGGASFLAFRQDMMQQVSPDLDVSNNVDMLMLCSDLSGYSQLAGYHAPGPAIGHEHKCLLGRARLMYAALAPQRFAHKFFASLPGATDGSKRSPFWDAIGRNFFHMDFMQVEKLLGGARNRALIAGLMPHYPVYVSLLPADARAALATVDPLARGGFEMLCDEGFEANDYVDICDGGPLLQASRHALKSYSSSMRRGVSQREHASAAGARRYLVCNAREQGFRAIAAASDPVEQQEFITLTLEERRLLDVGAGDEVVCIQL